MSDKFRFTSDLTAEATRELLKKEKRLEDEIKTKIPKFLKDFAFGQSRNWAESAWRAKHQLELDKQYIIENKDGRRNIVPVDYAKTGSLQQNMVLSDGLHQFLQIKHDLRLTAENLVTSFISNVGYFKRYGQNIFGLTGTIGTKQSQAFLKSEYHINIGFIPSFKLKQLKEVPIVLNKDINKWRSKI